MEYDADWMLNQIFSEDEDEIEADQEYPIDYSCDTGDVHRLGGSIQPFNFNGGHRTEGKRFRCRYGGCDVCP